MKRTDGDRLQTHRRTTLGSLAALVPSFAGCGRTRTNTPTDRSTDTPSPTRSEPFDVQETLQWLPDAPVDETGYIFRYNDAREVMWQRPGNGPYPRDGVGPVDMSNISFFITSYLDVIPNVYVGDFRADETIEYFRSADPAFELSGTYGDFQFLQRKDDEYSTVAVSDGAVITKRARERDHSRRSVQAAIDAKRKPRHRIVENSTLLMDVLRKLPTDVVKAEVVSAENRQKSEEKVGTRLLAWGTSLDIGREQQGYKTVLHFDERPSENEIATLERRYTFSEDYTTSVSDSGVVSITGTAKFHSVRGVFTTVFDY